MITNVRHGRSKPTWAVLVVASVAQFMVVLDVSIVTVALPQMRSALNLSTAGQQWIVNAYTLTFAGFLLLGGRAADLYGRRLVFLIGLTLFTTASLVGGFAQTGGWLIVARAVQGIGGAMLAPATLSVLTTTFVDPAQRRRALGVWAATAAGGVAVGVLAGGLLTDLLSWRWVLFVNVPVGVLLLVAAGLALSESRAAAARRHLDLPGAITVTGGFSVLVYGIVNTQTRSWGSPATIISLAAGVALLAIFVLIESRWAAHPLVPLSVFRRRNLTMANAVAITYGAAMFGMYIFLSLYFQQANHYSPLQAGLAFLPASVSTMIGSLLAARVVARIGARRQLSLALLATAVGLVWLSQLAPGAAYPTHALTPLVLAGLGFGMSMVPLTISATTDMPAHEAGLASGLLNTSRQIGGAIGLAAMATIAAANHAAHTRPTETALTNGYDHVFATSAAILLAGITLAILMPRTHKPKTTPSPSTAKAQLTPPTWANAQQISADVHDR